MNIIELNNVSLDYPLDNDDDFSFKKALLNFYLKAKAPKARYYRALDNISLTISRGEKIGIIGLNGAGKSTLLRVISGIFVPSSGDIIVRGNVSPLLDLSSGFEQNLTGIENIKIRLMFLGLNIKQIEEKIPEIIEFSGLGDFIDQPVRRYSSGMFLKLSFATSTAIDPEILVADEVIGVGDASFVSKARNRLENFLSRDCTLVLSSHSLDLLRNFCQRVIWLDKGRIVADGPIEEVISKYEQNIT